MKIGILTFHRADNYGAVLQCYALQEVLKSLGNEVEIINYKQPNIETSYAPIKEKELYNVLKKPLWYYGYFFKVLPKRYKKYIKYRLFRARYLNAGKEFKNNKEVPGKYDTIIIGSDQVWGLHCTNGIDEIFFGEFQHKECKIVGYGISGNILSLEKIGNESLKKYCRNFNKISFREESFKEYIKENIGVNGDLVLDPTLLLDKNSWEKVTDKIKFPTNYILTYFLQYGEGWEEMNEYISTFAKKTDCKVINIFDVANSPAEFLGWVKNAKYIITTSFHAAVFSIIFEKQFYAIKTHNGHDARYINLLNKLEISDRAIEFNELNSIKNSPIDYTKVKTILTKLKNASVEYLKSI